MRSYYILGIFAVVCFIFAAIFSADVSDVETKYLPSSGGEFGPLVVTEKNSAYEIKVDNYVKVGDWSTIEVEMLDENKQRLLSFADDMWHETGYDDEGQWVASKTDYSMDITIKDPGKYYFVIRAERSVGTDSGIAFKVVKQRGSNVIFLTLGFMSILFAGIAFYIDQKKVVDAANRKKHHMILIGVLVVTFIVALMYSSRGWGYTGYNGYRSGPSFFYFGGPRIYNQPSVRDGSISGSGQRGGGFSGGK